MSLQTRLTDLATAIGNAIKGKVTYVPVKAASPRTTSIAPLSGTKTVDGVALGVGDRVLVWQESGNSQVHGVYTVAAGAWTRAADADTLAKVQAGLVRVDQGTENSGRMFRARGLTSLSTLGTTPFWYVRVFDTGDSNTAGGVPMLDDNLRVPSGNLGSGTADGTTYLRGDGSWATPAGGGGSAGPLVTADVASTGNLTLSGTQTIDGQAVTAGQVVLAKNQTTQSANGPYTVAAGAWTRLTEADTAAELAGLQVRVLRGTVNGGKVFKTTFKSTDTLGTTAMTWYEPGGDYRTVGVYVTADWATDPANPLNGGNLPAGTPVWET